MSSMASEPRCVDAEATAQRGTLRRCDGGQFLASDAERALHRRGVVVTSGRRERIAAFR